MNVLEYGPCIAPKIRAIKNIVKRKRSYNGLDETFVDTYKKMKYEEEECIFSNKIQIFYAGKKGRGVKALDNIPKDTSIGCYGGRICRTKETKSFVYNFEYFFKDFCVEGRGLMALINHSDKPNCDVFTRFHEINGVIEPHLCFKTNRFIHKYEELTIDYGEEYWEEAYRNGIRRSYRQTLITEYFFPIKYFDDK